MNVKVPLKESEYMQIKSEAGIASGVRRIEAVAGPAAVDFLNERDSIVRSLTSSLNSTPSELSNRISGA